MTKFDTGENTVQKTNGWIAPDGADPFNHFLTGYHWDGKPFTVPLITRVGPTLWQGGFAENIDLGKNFDLVVSLYPWGKYKGTHVLHEYKMYDGAEVDAQTVNEASEGILAALRLGDRVFVHCQAGLNRSALVTANVLVKNGGQPAEVIKYLRDIRSPEVLFNEAFVKWLLNQPTLSPSTGE